MVSLVAELRDKSLAEGRRLAGLLFNRRNTRCEVHLSPKEVAMLTAVAYETGYMQACAALREDRRRKVTP